jgi:phosphoenolpyruvate synthase/pyruvate phosphate dikinase
MAILCLSPKAKYHLPQPSVNQVVVPEENNAVFYIDEVSWNKIVESLDKKYASHISRLERYEKEFIKSGIDYLMVCQKISKLKFEKLDNEKLIDFYLEYQEKLFRYSVFIWTSFILNNFVAERAISILEKYLEDKTENEKQDILDSLFQPIRKAAVLKLQDEVGKRKDKFSKKDFKILHQKYQWLSCLDLHNIPLTERQFESFIKEFKSKTQKKQASFAKFTEELKISRKDLEYLMMAKKFVYIKDARDDYRRQGIFEILPFFSEIAKRIGLEPKDISYLQSSEIVEFTRKKPPNLKSFVAERIKCFVLYLDKQNKLICLQSEKAKEVIELFKLPRKTKKGKIIHGTVASRGLAKGKVVIVKGVKDLKKVEQGNILVAITTHPDYTISMHKAAAIVTDEGGLTCHAAIVSRELGIPCIVGTKVATKTLKDGDKVIVDAVKGVVTKLDL